MIETFSLPGRTGEILSAYAPHLRSIVSSLQENQPVRVLKEGRARRVWVCRTEVGDVCVKEYDDTEGWIDRISSLLRGPRGLREWKRLVHCHSKHVPVPEPILYLRDRPDTGSHKSIVVLRYLPATLTLGEILLNPSSLNLAAKIGIAQCVGEGLAAMHAAGVLHRDLHPGNILVRTDLSPPEVALIDLHQVTVRRRLTWSQRLRNLGRLLGGHGSDLEIPLKQRALRAYLCRLTDWRPPFHEEREARRSMGRAIESFAAESFSRHWKSRIDKCMEPGKRFDRLAAGAYRGWIRKEHDGPEIREALRDPNDWLNSSHCRILKNTPTTTVARATVPDTDQVYFLKRYNRKDWWERTKNLVRRSRALKVWRAGYALEILGIPTPRVVCALEKRRGPLVLEALILTEWTEGGVGLDDFYRDNFGPQSQPSTQTEERRRLEREVASLFRRLHSHRISHGDLKGRNVLLDPRQPSPHAPCFVDLDAMTFYPHRFRRARINDLSRLLFSVYPIPSLLRQVRFFREYCRREPSVWTSRRAWFRDIRKRTERKLREKGLA